MQWHHFKGKSVLSSKSLSSSHIIIDINQQIPSDTNILEPKLKTEWIQVVPEIFVHKKWAMALKLIGWEHEVAWLISDLCLGCVCSVLTDEKSLKNIALKAIKLITTSLHAHLHSEKRESNSSKSQPMFLEQQLTWV